MPSDVLGDPYSFTLEEAKLGWKPGDAGHKLSPPCTNAAASTNPPAGEVVRKALRVPTKRECH